MLSPPRAVVQVRERLGLDTLQCVDEENRTRTPPGSVVSHKVHASGVNHVERVGYLVCPRHARSLTL